MEDEKKISTVAIVLMLMLAVSADAMEIILDFFAGNDFGMMAIVDAILIFWLTMKGAKAGWVIGGAIMELIPWVDALPIRTIVLLVAIYLTNHPNKLTKVTQKVISAGIKK